MDDLLRRCENQIFLSRYYLEPDSLPQSVLENPNIRVDCKGRLYQNDACFALGQRVLREGFATTATKVETVVHALLPLLQAVQHLHHEKPIDFGEDAAPATWPLLERYNALRSECLGCKVNTDRRAELGRVRSSLDDQRDLLKKVVADLFNFDEAYRPVQVLVTRFKFEHQWMTAAELARFLSR